MRVFFKSKQLLACLVILVSFISAAGASVGIERLQYILSPGELNYYHSFIAGLNNCMKCHDLSEGVSSEKCIACHSEIGHRIEQNIGYHGGFTKRCNECHPDHEKIIVNVSGVNIFDHNNALFSLDGKHRMVRCEKCHLKTEFNTGGKRFTYIGLPKSCVGCHINTHRTVSTDECTKCHTVQGWQIAEFDHDNKTGYVLAGLHRTTLCQKCHTPFKEKDKGHYYVIKTSDGCISCHKDRHKQKLSQQCQQCHTIDGWKKLRFTHDSTRYPLKGRHASIKCDACHIGEQYIGIESASCYACHKKSSHLKTSSVCSVCHTERGWNKLVERWEIDAVDHSRYRYALEGAHQKLRCEKCHMKQEIRTYTGMKFESCSSCHSDTHKGQFKDGKCEVCHNQVNFKALIFDHEKSAFPLGGLHGKITCDKCHPANQYTGISSECRACHKRETDYYNGSLAGYPDDLPYEKSRLVQCVNCHPVSGDKVKRKGELCIPCHAASYAE
ncbi:hypothetical protein H8E50_09810, partial [bacterium]|nr:hypothetical protein [bacterium]